MPTATTTTKAEQNGGADNGFAVVWPLTFA
ncbi:MAG: hypothetical protein DVB22_001070 [Verrucomicrobia bacterium]|nr:MAG: hypothetical protein DVB22_001070 [Verrucomicrobiota bacterium]